MQIDHVEHMVILYEAIAELQDPPRVFWRIIRGYRNTLFAY